tara:strand:- start:374 stop:604 length:231 start_codon:yes stop_codon:yes gene_type:complete
MKKLELERAEKKEKAAYKKMQKIRNNPEKVKEEFLAAIKSLKESKGAESEEKRLLELINGRNLHATVEQTPIQRSP